jgi:putative membrane protein
VTVPVTAEPVTVAPIDEWRRLDPRMLIIHPVVELARALPALLGLLLAGQGSGHGSRWSLIATAIVAGSATLRWFTTRFRVTTTQIQLRHGLFRRRTVAAPLDRVRTVDVTAHALHRILGLARVVIGTGTSDRKGRPGLTLDGLRQADAARLRAELLHRLPVEQPPAPAPDRAGAAPPATSEDSEIFRLPKSWVRYAPFTLSGALTAAAIAGFAWRVDSEAHINPDRFGPLRAVIDHLGALPLWRDVLELGAAAVVFIAGASTAGYVLAFWNFRLSRHIGGTLHVSRGLITARATSIEERRIRGVEVSEPLLLRTVGGARTIVIATGLRVGRGAERGGTMVMPPGPLHEAVRVAEQALGVSEPFTTPLLRHGRRATRRRYARALAGGVALAAAIALIWRVAGLHNWGWLAGLILVPISVPLAADRARSLGHALTGGYLVTRRGSLVRRRAVLAGDGIIGVNLRATYFQRRAGLATLTATTAAGRQGYRVQDVAEPAAVGLGCALLPGLLAEFLEPDPDARRAPGPAVR